MSAIVAQVAAGRGMTEVAAQYGISVKNIYNWHYSAHDYAELRIMLSGIDETDFASQLNDAGKLTNGVFNPGNRHRSVKVMGHPIKLLNQGTNRDLARALHARILANSPSYKPDCEFHYSQIQSTKDHTKSLP